MEAMQKQHLPSRVWTSVPADTDEQLALMHEFMQVSALPRELMRSPRACTESFQQGPAVFETCSPALYELAVWMAAESPPHVAQHLLET